LFVTFPAFAEDKGQATSADPPASTAASTGPPARWYGWQTLIVDSIAASLAIAGVDSRQDTVTYSGLTLYAVGPPVVHGLHQRPGAALADVALRAGAPVLLALIGVGIEDATTPPCQDTGDMCFRGLGGGFIGAVAGYAAALAIDTLVLARERPSDDGRKDGPPAPTASSLLLTPVVTASTKGATAGVGGSF
jgi:hypothetical protein